jgi:hypothetical protein
MRKLTLVARLHGNDAAVPSVHNTLPERSDVIDHLVVALGCQGDLTSLLKHLGNDKKVCLERTVDGVRNIAKALEDSWLKLVAEYWALFTRLVLYISSI